MRDSCAALVESWENGWLVSFSEPYKDHNHGLWVDAKFSKPTSQKPIPSHYVSVRFKIEEDVPVSYLIECDRTEKAICYPITDQILEMYIRIKAKGGAMAKKYDII